MLITVLAALVLLGVLIAVHEFGHFWTARRFGVKVLTFSIGFGPAIWQHQGRDGVTYRIAAIPLGGYVRMADETEGEVAADELHRAFNRQSPWVKAAITAAGPLINLLLAVLISWFLFLFPQQSLTPHVAQVTPGSAAALAGLKPQDRVLQVDGTSVKDWRDIHRALVERLGETGQVNLTVARQPDGQPASTSSPQVQLQLPITHFMQGQDQRQGNDPAGLLGMQGWRPFVPAVLGEMDPNGAAALQGLKTGDRVVAINNQPVKDWFELVKRVQTQPEQMLQFQVIRMQQGQPTTLTLPVMPRGERGAIGRWLGRPAVGKLGVQNQKIDVKAPAVYQQTIQYGPIEALGQGLKQTWQMSVMSVEAFGKLLTGKLDLSNLSGPLTIAQVAGDSARLGWQPYLTLMALISISLGVMNLMPVPVLDGGQILFHVTEGIRRKPLSDRFKAAGMRVGLLMLGSLMLLALFNDFARLG